MSRRAAIPASCRRALVMLALAPAVACAQESARPSQLATTSQMVADTRITVEGYRPVARGRDSLFGGVVHWGREWATGANWATTLDVDHDVRLDGRALPKGKYSVWMIPQPAPRPWTLVVSRDAHRFHMQPPDEKDDQLRVDVQPRAAPWTEVLTWSFPAVAPVGATLELRWGTTAVPLEIAVTPAGTRDLTVREPARYDGRWRIAGDAAAAGTELTITDSAGTLHAHAAPAADGLDAEFDLLPDGDDRFHPGHVAQGAVLDLHPDVTLAFEVKDGRATALHLLTVDGRALGDGVRVP